jgi:UDP-N-acetylmuramate dehydrogenase
MKQIDQQQIDSYLATVPSAKRDEPMSGHTTLKVGGPARLFVVAETAEALVQAAQAATSVGVPFVVIGGGSNVLVSDEGFEGVVIVASDRTVTVDGTNVTAAAGAFTSLVARKAGEAGCAGFEWGATVPGTIGGATYGNAGCFGGEMKDVVASVDALDVAKGERVTLQNAECGFGYRDSRFKREPFVILSVTLALKQGDAAGIAKAIDALMEKRKASQPLGAGSAGCLFKNFMYDDDAVLEILKRHVDEIPADMLNAKRISAGWLVDRLGLKGTKVGGAQVSPEHGNFIVNTGTARAQDIIALSSIVKMKVRDDLGILLEDEVQLVGF